MLIQQFRQTVYQIFGQRADASLDMIDAMTVAGQVTSPVALSENGLFRRQYSSVYDVLRAGEIEGEALAQALYNHQPPESETVAGYEVYAVDATDNERPSAETAGERGLLKHNVREVAREGYKFSWLVRLVGWRSSWVAPIDVQRVKPASTDNVTAVEQVKRLDAMSARRKVVVADSLYANVVFLSIFLFVTTVVGLVRLRNNQVLYEEPPPRRQGQRGAPRKHGAKFKLATPPRPPDQSDTITLLGQSVRIRAWQQLHLRKLALLVGMVLCVEFLRKDSTPRFRYPLWLLWTGPTDVPLADIARIYLWRFAIEHAFRFLKQHLGLKANQSTNLVSIERWMWFCAIAYLQLLLMRQQVDDLRPAWHPKPNATQPRLLTPGQVQRAAHRFLARLGTPAQSPRPAGKGTGRRQGFCPKARTRHPVVRKLKKRPKPKRKAVV
ncbi:transposase [Serratia sp. (in: enterobacteria)]|uniref:transposase n=1 Tax=Serratia sp. (in: enterobacteria) TaxID=616 RepID=UPI003988DDA2